MNTNTQILWLILSILSIIIMVTFNTKLARRVQRLRKERNDFLDTCIKETETTKNNMINLTAIAIKNAYSMAIPCRGKSNITAVHIPHGANIEDIINKISKGEFINTEFTDNSKNKDLNNLSDEEKEAEINKALDKLNKLRYKK